MIRRPRPALASLRLARPAAAALAVLMQLMLLLTPVSEWRDARAAASGVAVAASAGAVQIPHGGSQKAHDETTCPACIARSLHARLEARAPLPTLSIEERAPLESWSLYPPGIERASAHPSRAPPALI